MTLTPINGCVVVELQEQFEHVATPDKQFSTKTNGIVLVVPKSDEENQYLVGKRVYFEEFRDGTQVKEDGKEYAFIKLEDIRGYSEQAK